LPLAGEAEEPPLLSFSGERKKGRAGEEELCARAAARNDREDKGASARST